MTRRDEIIDDLAAGTVPDPMYFHDVPDEWIDAAVKRAEGAGEMRLPRLTDAEKEAFGDTGLLEFDPDTGWQWSQAAVDFACAIQSGGYMTLEELESRDTTQRQNALEAYIEDRARWLYDAIGTCSQHPAFKPFEEDDVLRECIELNGKKVMQQVVRRALAEPAEGAGLVCCGKTGGDPCFGCPEPQRLDPTWRQDAMLERRDAMAAWDRSVARAREGLPRDPEDEGIIHRYLTRHLSRTNNEPAEQAVQWFERHCATDSDDLIDHYARTLRTHLRIRRTSDEGGVPSIPEEVWRNLHRIEQDAPRPFSDRARAVRYKLDRAIAGQPDSGEDVT